MFNDLKSPPCLLLRAPRMSMLYLTPPLIAIYSLVASAPLYFSCLKAKVEILDFENYRGILTFVLVLELTNLKEVSLSG